LKVKISLSDQQESVRRKGAEGELKRKESTEKGMFLVFEVRSKNQAEETVAMGLTTVQVSNTE
jgi:hypothetical protein